MGWLTRMTGLLVLRYIMTSVAADMPHHQSITIPRNVEEEEETLQGSNELGEMEPMTPLEQYENFKLDHLGKLLANILIQPWPKGVSPILYVEDLQQTEPIHEQLQPIETNRIADEELSNTPFKRSRYYRKYPWKRQNSRYDAENRYLCQPSKEDVFRLLVALHEARQGTRGQTVNFCNRKRPASAIFTNIRFLG